MGHSQGGLTGALALPWMSQDIEGAVLSGAGGVLAMTIVKRKDPLDFQALMEGILQLDEGDELNELHPMVTLEMRGMTSVDYTVLQGVFAHPDGGQPASLTDSRACHSQRVAAQAARFS